MENTYIEERINNLERILSTGYKYEYALDFIERGISYCSYFQMIERHQNPFPLSSALVDSIYYDIKVDHDEVPTYRECLWAAEAYVRIQNHTRLSFEAIFLIMPLKEMYNTFPLYHELDFSKIIEHFMNKQKEKTIFSLLLKKYGYKLDYVAKKVDISINTLYSFKQGKRDMKKANVDLVQKLASFFNVRIETFAGVML